MVLARPIAGVILGNCFGNFWYFFIGSIIPDIDHIFVLISRKIFLPKDIIKALRFEKKYQINFKTKYVHSLLGALILSTPIMLFNFEGGLAFLLGYFIHLLLDWVDIDDKYFLFPLKKKFSGFLPIFSKKEIIFTVILFLIMIWSF